jgi:hypothetical protein
MPTPDVSTTYGGGSVTTETQPGPYRGLPSDINDLLAQVMRKRLMGAQPAQGPSASYAAQPAAVAPPSRPEESSHDRYMQSMRDRDELLQMQARQGAAPTRMTTFASGANNGYVMDPTVMNAYQRQLFLPQGSAMAPNRAASGAIKTPGEDEAEFGAFQAASGADPRGVRGEVGGAAPGTPGGSVVPHGTAPMLTPGNASTPPRKRSLAELARQAQVNQQYGR